MILMLDDERRIMSSYVEDLKLSGLDVEFSDDPEAALELLEGDATKVDLLILDLMMPPGERFEKVDTERGLRTGVRVYEAVRAMAPHLPVVILTNVSDPKIERRFRAEKNCSFFRKEQVLPFEFTKQVTEFIQWNRGT